jgi:hypothetical protein
MQKVSRHIFKIILISILSNSVFLPAAIADSSAPEIVSVKASILDVYVGKRWNNVTFQVVVKDQSLSVKSSKSILKSTNTQNKDLICDDVNTIERTVSGDFFQHRLAINCVLPRVTSAPEVRYIQFTVTDGAGLSTEYTTDTFNSKINFIYGFDPKVVEQSQTDAGKLRLVEECTNYERQRINTIESYKAIATFPAGNPFETNYKEGKTALAKPFNCNLGSDLLTRVSDYEDLAKRLFVYVGETANYQTQLLIEKINALKPKSITCVKGKLSKVVKGSNPKCPKGYKKK